MAYTVKQVAAMSGVSVRTLHFYDESGLLKKFSGGGGGPRHRHFDQDEWIYVIDGTIDLLMGETRLRLGAGESVFIPRTVSHGWGCVSGKPSKIINVYQPAGKMEEFFRAVGESKDLPTREQVLENTYTEEQIATVHQLFAAHGMDLLGPPHISDE
jgi:quercetin dioxygenase-like cupin family protein